MCSFWDMMPTFAQITGEKATNSDGFSILPTLTGKGKQQAHEYLYFEFQEEGGKQGIRQGDWKLIRFQVNKGDNSYYELYNLAADPQEIHNVAAIHPEKVASMKKLMLEAHVNDPNWPLYER